MDNILKSERLRGSNEGSVSSINTAYTNPASTNLLVVFLGTHNQDVTAIKYGGIDLTLQEKRSEGDGRGFLYTLEDPPTGENQLEVTLSDSSNLGVHMYSLKNVDTIKETRKREGNNDLESSITFDTDEGDLVISFFRWRNSDNDFSEESGQTAIHDDTPTRKVSSYKEAGAGFTTEMSYTNDSGSTGGQTNTHVGLVIGFLGEEVEYVPGHRIELTIDHTKVEDDLTEFPVYVNLSDLPAGFFDKVRADGGDIRVFKSDGETELPLEVVSFDKANSKGHLFFKADLSSSVDTKAYIYYNSPESVMYTRGGEYGLENVWNSNYKVVHHLVEASSANTAHYRDSTANRRHGTGGPSVWNPEPPDQVDGALGKAAQFDGVEQSISSANDFQFIASEASVQAFIRRIGDGQSSRSQVAGLGYHGAANIIGFRVTDENILQLGQTALVNGDITFDNLEGPAINQDWLLAHGTIKDTGPKKLYIDGDEIASSNNGLSFLSEARPVEIGGFNQTDWAINRRFHGEVAEFRLLNIELSAEWIETEHNNLNESSTFYEVGAEETLGFVEAEYTAQTVRNITRKVPIDLVFNDWYLPPLNAVNAMWDNLHDEGVGNLTGTNYWSSSEYSALSAHSVRFSDKGNFINGKNVSSNFNVRPIRSFSSNTLDYALRDTGPGGGLIFYIDSSTPDYYIFYEAYTEDFVNVQWSNITDVLIGGTSQDIGSGEQNTSLIIAQEGHTDSAAKDCDDLVLIVYHPDYQTVRTVKKIQEYEGQGIRNITKLQEYVAQTVRNIVEAIIAYYQGQTVRVIKKLQQYSGQSVRIITRLQEYVGQGVRFIKKLQTYTGQGVRVIKKLRQYAGQSVRNITRLQTYSGQGIRTIKKLQTYVGQSVRSINKLQIFTAQTVRNITEAITAYFQGQTIRVIKGLQTYTGQGVRIINKLQLYTGQGVRKIKRLQAYTAQTVKNITSVITVYYQGQRVITKIQTYSGQGVRRITRLQEYTGQTIRNILDAVIAIYHAQAFRYVIKEAILKYITGPDQIVDYSTKGEKVVEYSPGTEQTIKYVAGDKQIINVVAEDIDNIHVVTVDPQITHAETEDLPTYKL